MSDSKSFFDGINLFPGISSKSKNFTIAGDCHFYSEWFPIPGPVSPAGDRFKPRFIWIFDFPRWSLCWTTCASDGRPWARTEWAPHQSTRRWVITSTRLNMVARRNWFWTYTRRFEVQCNQQLIGRPQMKNFRPSTLNLLARKSLNWKIQQV